jgi:hypothetical protein
LFQFYAGNHHVLFRGFIEFVAPTMSQNVEAIDI